MFDEKKIKELILTSLVTDAYCLGSHWVYDEKQLKENDLNWNELNNPLSVWHKEKSLGDFTHYGDQTYWLYEFLQNKETFDEKEYFLVIRGETFFITDDINILPYFDFPIPLQDPRKIF